MLHLELWFELEFEFLKIILTRFVGSTDVSSAAAEKESGVFVQQQLCYVVILLFMLVVVTEGMFLVT